MTNVADYHIQCTSFISATHYVTETNQGQNVGGANTVIKCATFFICAKYIRLPVGVGV